ncbi:hypothetical protein D1Z90_19580 [Motilimonas pumila]|uniref:Uncharacterized protein n=1 Tax=Motilimonas pumila TaxID=2303987 RepID=A0A418Y9K8_9GAMM|nr:hypothetical protein D1Z90_19580 [Motilimonas pumila]
MCHGYKKRIALVLGLMMLAMKLGSLYVPIDGWYCDVKITADKRPDATPPVPANKLTEAEQAKCNLAKYASLPPTQMCHRCWIMMSIMALNQRLSGIKSEWAATSSRSKCDAKGISV